MCEKRCALEEKVWAETDTDEKHTDMCAILHGKSLRRSDDGKHMVGDGNPGHVQQNLIL